MNALVLFFNGKLPTKSELNELVDNMSFADGVVSVSTLSAENVAKLIVKATSKPKFSTEEGDAAVTVLAGIVDVENDCKFVVQMFNHLRKHNDAVIRACSVLSQGYPISSGIADRYGFNEDKVRIIKQLYNEYKNSDNV